MTATCAEVVRYYRKGSEIIATSSPILYAGEVMPSFPLEVQKVIDLLQTK